MSVNYSRVQIKLCFFKTSPCLAMNSFKPRSLLARTFRSKASINNFAALPCSRRLERLDRSSLFTNCAPRFSILCSTASACDSGDTTEDRQLSLKFLKSLRPDSTVLVIDANRWRILFSSNALVVSDSAFFCADSIRLARIFLPALTRLASGGIGLLQRFKLF